MITQFCVLWNRTSKSLRLKLSLTGGQQAKSNIYREKQLKVKTKSLVWHRLSKFWGRWKSFCVDGQDGGFSATSIWRAHFRSIYELFRGLLQIVVNVKVNKYHFFGKCNTSLISRVPILGFCLLLWWWRNRIVVILHSMVLFDRNIPHFYFASFLRLTKL